MASAKSDSKNTSDQFPIHNEQKENQPKQANMITTKKTTANKSTLTEERNETITIESPEDDKCKYKCGEFSSDRQFHILLDNFLNIVRQKKIIYVNISTQTDDVTNFSYEDKANEEFQERSKGTRSTKGTDNLNDIESFSQEFKNFLFELYSSTQRLFKENISNNERTFVYSHDTRLLFLKIIKSVVDLITLDEKTIKDFSNNTTAAADIVNLVVNDNENKETPKENVHLAPNNNKDATLTQTQTTQNIMQQNNSAQVEENNHVQEDSSNTEHSFIAEQFAPNTLVKRDPQTPQTVNYNNETSHEIVQQSNVLNAQLNFNNNAFNPQSAQRFTRTPRPQIMHQHQLYHRAGYISDYQNKMYRYPGKGNDHKETPKENVHLAPNNNKDATLTQTQTAQNIIQENNSAQVEENNHVQEDSSNTEHSFIAEQLAPNILVKRHPQTPQTVNYNNETSHEIVQQSNVLNAQLNFNNFFNPQSARRFTRTPRPQIMHQHQLYHRAGYISDYQNKMYRYPGKGNIRPTPYQQKLQKRQSGQQQGIEPIQCVPMQHAYYQANPQQFIHQQMQYQQNFH